MNHCYLLKSMLCRTVTYLVTSLYHLLMRDTSTAQLQTLDWQLQLYYVQTSHENIQIISIPLIINLLHPIKYLYISWSSNFDICS
jgi:hypothetical protein